MPLRILTVCVVLLLLATGSVMASAPASPQREVTLGIVDTNEPGWRAQTLNPTIKHLHNALPHYRFRLVELSVYQTIEDVGRIRPDFILAPSDVFMQLIYKYGAQALAVRQPPFASNPAQSVGSTVIVPVGNIDIQTLADLQNKVIAASLPDSLGGWLALQGELVHHGVDPKHFFSKVHFVSFQIPDVINHVLNGHSDAGVLSACQLESAIQSGLLEPGLLRVIGEKHSPQLACSHSTALYPDQVFGVLNFTEPEILKQVSIVLLSMPQQSNISWQVAGKFDSVANLYQTLSLSPWEHQRWTLQRFLQHFKYELLLALSVLLLVLFNEIRLNHLVHKRTHALKQTLMEKEQLAHQENLMRKRIGLMERNTIAAQMSSMIAHELKQPLAAIINYMAVLKLQLESLQIEDSRVDKAVERVESETHRITEIVDRVRSYVKRPHSTLTRCSLSAILQKSITTFRHYADVIPLLDVSLDSEPSILGDELELEILFLNLLKNAAVATRSVSDAMISVKMHQDGNKCLVYIADNGPKLSDEAFDRLTAVSESTTGGLGLGLGIVRSIADAHSADLHIRRLAVRGIEVCVAFDLMEPMKK